MEFQNLIEKRRSVRKYVERNTVTKDEILSMIKAAQEAPSWKNSQTGRYYCIMDEKNVEQFRRECLPEMNAGKCENAVLLVSTFVHNRAGFQKDGTADNEIGNGWAYNISRILMSSGVSLKSPIIRMCRAGWRWWSESHNTRRVRAASKRSGSLSFSPP